jgi:hypothetical protein
MFLYIECPSWIECTPRTSSLRILYKIRIAPGQKLKIVNIQQIEKNKYKHNKILYNPRPSWFYTGYT